MNKNKFIASIIFLALLFIASGFIFSDPDNRISLALMLAGVFIVSIILLMIFLPLKIGFHLIQLFFHGIPFSALKRKFLISGVALAFSLLMMALIVPKLLKALQAGRVTNPVISLMQIHRSEAEFYSKKKRFANLDELVDAGLLGKYYRENQVVNGFRFSTSAVTKQTFCIHADRTEKSSGDRDFNVSEDGEVRQIYSENIGTVARGAGKLLTGETQ